MISLYILNQCEHLFPPLKDINAACICRSMYEGNSSRFTVQSITAHVLLLGMTCLVSEDKSWPFSTPSFCSGLLVYM